MMAESESDLAQVFVRDLTRQVDLPTETFDGYGTFANSSTEAVWRSSSDAFAVSFRGTKRTFHTDVYFLESNVWEKVEMPAYEANILGRQGVVHAGRNIVEGFVRFDSEDVFVLAVHIEPDWQEKELTHKITSWKPSEQTEYLVTLKFNRNTAPNCSIVAIDPDQREGETGKKRGG